LIVDAGSALDRHRAGALTALASNVVSCSLDTVATAAQESAPQCVLLDSSYTPLISRAFVDAIRRNTGNLPILMAVPSGAVLDAVEAMRAGVDWVIEEPLSVSYNSGLKRWLEEFNDSRVRAHFSDTAFGKLVGASDVMREVYSQILAVAPRDTTVLVTGESGTGKELVAREIHERSGRAQGPFVAINCGAIPDELIESELFGHERGSFTSACERRIGSVEQANCGTLFLDEVSELSPRAQVKLLRFLQERQVQRIGSSKPISVDTRVIAAANRDIDELVQNGSFRRDLLYRINVVHLTLPALRERKQDIDLLFCSCLKKLSPRYGGRKLRLANEAKDVLVRYSWPGNVRELENTAEYLLALQSSDEVQVIDLPAKILKSIGADRSRIKVELETSSAQTFDEANRLLETELIISALERSHYVQSKAASLLGISRRILKYKMDKLGIVNSRCGYKPSLINS